MMTGQPGQSDGGRWTDTTTEDGEAAALEALRGNGTNKKGSLIPGAPLTKKPRSGQPKQGPKDQSAADILISIMKAERFPTRSLSCLRVPRTRLGSEVEG